MYPDHPTSPPARCRPVGLAACLLPLLLVLPLLAAQPSQMDLLNDQRVIQIGDRLVYQVVEEREPGVVVFVNDRGEVELPLIGALPADGRTCKQLAFELREILEEAFFHQATVLLRHQYADNSRGRVTLVGRIARPGPLNIPADEVLTVSAAVLRAGGLAQGADARRVMVKRADGDDVREIVVDLIEVLERGNLAADLPVRADDIIVVPESASASGSYYITGAVNAPGEFKLPVDGAAVLLSQAILRAGGFAKFANRTEVLIIRENPANPDKPERLTVNVRAILDEGRRSEDVELRANDTIRVREVLFAF